MSWPIVKLQDLVDINIGRTPSRDNPEYWGEGVSWLSIRDMNQGKLLSKTAEQITEFAVKETKCKIAKKGTVLFSFKLSIGKVGIAEIDMFHNEAIAAMPIKKGVELCEEYLYFALLQMDSAKSTDRAVMGATLNKKKMAELEIPLPPLETQKQIAAVLEQADQLRKDCKLLEQELNSLAQSVFIEMFGDPVTNPKGWEMGLLGKNAKLLAGFAFKSKEYSKNPEHVRLCRGINIFPGKMNWKNSEYWDYKNENHLEKFELKENDIVIAMDRPWVSGGFKMATIIKSDLPALLLQRVMRVRGKSKEQAKFLYHALRQPAFLNHCKMTETTVPHISPKDVSSYNIPVPSADELAKFYRLINRIDENIELTKLDSNEAETAFNSLMQKAFKGELNL